MHPKTWSWNWSDGSRQRITTSARRFRISSKAGSAASRRAAAAAPELRLESWPIVHRCDPMPKPFDLCRPTARKAEPDGPDWIHEIKYDGYRGRVIRNGAEIYPRGEEISGSRNGRSIILSRKVGEWGPEYPHKPECGVEGPVPGWKRRPIARPPVRSRADHSCPSESEPKRTVQIVMRSPYPTALGCAAHTPTAVTPAKSWVCSAPYEQLGRTSYHIPGKK
jgi:hypothetical protein